MANRVNRKRGDVEEPKKWSSEIAGICWMAGGLILLLSLLSYSPADLPNVGIFETFAGDPDEHGENLLGPVGGVLAFVQILLLGAAGWMLALGFVWFGILKMAFRGRLWPRIATGLAVVLLTAAIWLHAAEIFFGEWVARCEMSGRPGGVLGHALGGSILMPIIGKGGTLVISAIGYFIGLIWLTGQTPLEFLRDCHALVKAKIAAWKASRTEAGRAESRERELLAERERQREQLKLEREIARLKAAETDEPGQKELPIRETPMPQIIDSSQRRTAEPMEAGAKPFERRKPSHQSLSVADYADYELPGFDLLDEVEEEPESANHEELLEIQTTIVDTLKAFGIDVTPGDITRGPTITRYEIYPSTGLRVSRISQLEADLARATRAERINILAPIPGKDTVGIEIANSTKVAVPLHELLHDPDFRSAKKKIPLALGKDVYGKTVIGDLAAMPHLLVAGATGSGKSVCINSIIASILFKFGPDELRFIMVDPKVVEMQMYNKLPHMVVPVVTDPKKTVAALKWVVNEMEKRYKIFAKMGVRNFDGFNNRPREEKESEPEVPEEEEPEVDLDEIEAIATALGEGDLGPEADFDELEVEEDEIPDRFPYIVVLIDELADLMQTAPADVEMCIARIAQKARAAGIHLIIATQTPRADVVTGIIKANIPSRIAFQVSSALDSRVILDTKGADKLVGKGDMLYLPPGSAKLERAQGAFVSDEEVERIVEHCANQAKPRYEKDISMSIEAAGNDEQDEVSDADEEMIIRCIEVVRQEQKASTSLLQRRLRLGYTRAARMVDILEQRGIVGPGDGAKAREVFLK
ncbi:DNA translocase FtsK 4TM domain-containing protein [Luteolibacter algae]|uniref:DNA translocase FtsK 4TM domain-containing protein n=1 Tax=Luteolibacter algae TaxID=454151 RepID=A0ABW5D5D2_9BACT